MAYIEMYRAMIAKDIPALSSALDDSFVLVHMTGILKPPTYPSADRPPLLRVFNRRHIRFLTGEERCVK